MINRAVFLKIWCDRWRRLAALLLATSLLIGPSISLADIIWNGHFNDGNFRNYHKSDKSPGDPDAVNIPQVPAYGRPIQYGGQGSSHVGNGELLSLVSSLTRGSRYSAKFTVKSQASGGVEPLDCDPATACDRRRSQLQMTKTLLEYYNAIPNGAERWVSFSVYLPSDFNSSGPGFGPLIWGSKSSSQNKPGAFGVQINNDSWQLIHRYYSQEMQNKGVDSRKSWWLATSYSSSFPSSSDWPAGRVDFPNETASKAAMANLNLGGWTDFVWHFKTDIREFEQNKGFLDVYMRAGAGTWVHVLKIRPMKDLARSESWRQSNPERVYDRGIGQYGPGGYTSAIGLYMAKERVWDNTKSMTVYIDNHKVGSERATFSMMSHDGSSPGNTGVVDDAPPPPPKPPQLLN